MKVYKQKQNQQAKAKQSNPKASKKYKNKSVKLVVDSWNTTDADEIERRRLRGQIEKFQLKNLNTAQTYFSTFVISSGADRQYHVEIRSLAEQINSCDCPDYRGNKLGTCKHIEHVLFRLKKFGVKLFKQARLAGSPQVEIFFDTRNAAICVYWPKQVIPKIRKQIEPFFSTDGALLDSPVVAYPALCAVFNKQPKNLRISRHIEHFVAYQQRLLQKQHSKEVFLNDVVSGKRTLNIMKHQLYPYQHDGMLHLMCNERALLADEMGLGKTVQAIAACELLRRHKNISRVLVIATASLKAEWEEQIAKFTDLPSLIIQGSRANRLRQYQQEAFFYLTNYEQVVMDGADIQRLLAPDVIILDEAQRIKNWHTKTAAAIKQLSSHYAFVLTGTPLENRIDDVYSIIQFLDPYIFGPLFRFNRDFYSLDEKGKPIGYKNLDELHQRLRPIMLRRRKSDVEEQLPKRTVNNYFVEMDGEQQSRYGEYKDKVARLLRQLEHRPLRKEEFERLQRWLACMRMLCDTPFILDPDYRASPKITELAKILAEVLIDPTAKILIFSEWERMLQLVRELAQKKHLDFAWHTGSVPQPKRRIDINRFKNNPECRLFLSTDSGSIGLNLQSANIVINLDLPWNPAKLEQRIARAWRKHQMRHVQVINLVCENSIEHRMLGLLAQKQDLAKGVLEGDSGLKEMKLPSGRNAFMERMESLMGPSSDTPLINNKPAPIKTDPTRHICDALLAELPENIDLLQTYHHSESNQQTALVVVNSNSDLVKQKIHKHVQQQAQQSSLISLETLDRETFALIQRLAQAGVLTLNVPTGTLHTSKDLAAATNELQAKQISQAKKYLDQAARKQRMTKILVDDEFYEEAVMPLREAVGLIIQACAWLSGKGENFSIDQHKNNLTHSLPNLPQNTEKLFLQLKTNNSLEICKTNPTEIKNLLLESQEIFAYVAAAVQCKSDTILSR